jgi:glycosyltransferase involved in cell wall biosynthesis
MKILAVIPAYNEAAAIAPVAGAVNVLGYDVLVVDDGSSDSTAELAKVAGAMVLSTGHKSGKGNALRQGFGYAIGHDYDAVITLDGDGQHAPSDMRKFIEGHKATGASIVNGNRMHDPKGMPALRLVTNAFMSWMISLICCQRVPDTQCGFRFVTTEVLKAIKLECCGFEIETEMLIKASKKGFKISSVSVETIYRDEKSKIQPFKDTVRFIRYITKEAFKK